MGRSSPWLQEDIRWLRFHSGMFKNKFLADYLKRTENAVKSMVCRLRKEDQRVENAKKQ